MTEVNEVKSFEEHSRNIACKFLRNVLSLDNQAHMLSADDFAGTPGDVSAPGPESVVGELRDHNRVSAADDRLDAKALVRGFAKLGLMCAPLVPDVDDADGDDALVANMSDAAKRADILILDWWMGIDRNWDEEQLAEKVLERVLTDDQSIGGRLRLVAVYTAEPDTGRVLERTDEILTRYYERYEKLPRTEQSSTVVNWISRGPFRLVILRKGSDDIGDHEEVSESGLANRLVEEYAELTGGLLSNVALSGLAALRDRAHQVLATFDRSMDPAFLSHRLLLSNPDDAEGHVVDTLGAELLSILEEQEAGKQVGEAAVVSWLHQVGEVGVGGFTGQEKVGDSKLEAWQFLLTRGASMSSLSNSQVNEMRKNATEALGKLHAGNNPGRAAREANFRFAYLMKMKNVYTADPPKLSLGTVLRRENDGIYLFCLQPKCDSVRLMTKTAFPFLSLKLLSEGERFDLVVKDGLESDGLDKWVCLAVEPKTRNLVLPNFEPDGVLEVILAEKRCGGGLYFSDDKGAEYCWVSEMKDEHASKVVGDLSSNLARPGPNDSEWLRRNATRN